MAVEARSCCDASGRRPRRAFEREFTIPLPRPASSLDPQTNNLARPTNLAGHLPPATNRTPADVRATWMRWDVGNGRVHLLSNSPLFSRAGLGNVMAEPNELQIRLYRIAFDVFREALGTTERPPQ